MNTKAAISSVIFLSLVLGCTTHAPMEERHISSDKDSISYGAVTSKVQKGVTTQAEILELFGAPNITTIGSDENEIWVYDKISTESRGSSYSEAKRFDAFFGLGTMGGGKANSESSYSSSTRTLTVIITFNKEKKVIDYSARATSF